MAHGAPDYWTLQPVSLFLPPPGITLDWGSGSRLIAGGANWGILTITPLDGFELYVAGLMVTCDFPCLSHYRISSGGVTSENIYFNTYSTFPIAATAPLRTVFGNAFGVRVYNDDTDPHTYSVVVVDYEVTVISRAFGGIGPLLATSGL